MSVGVRIVLGMALASAAVGAIQSAVAPSLGANSWLLYLSAVLYVIGAVACVGGKVGNASLRILAAFGCFLGVSFAIAQFLNRDQSPSLLGAWSALVGIAVPTGGFALFGGRWYRDAKEAERRRQEAAEAVAPIMRFANRESDDLGQIATDLGLRPVPFEPVEEDLAERIAMGFLQYDLAYSGRRMEDFEASAIWAEFLSAFDVNDPTIRFYTNVDLTFGEDSFSDVAAWSSATDATFDAGILVVAREKVGCLWVADEH